MDALDTLFPAPRVVQAGGKSIDLHPIKVRQIAAFTRAVGPALRAAEANGDLLLQGEQLVDAVAVAAQQDPVWVAGLPAADYLRLATAVLEVNGDFFAQLLPAIQGSTAVLRHLTGPTPAPSSPPADTGLPT